MYDIMPRKQMLGVTLYESIACITTVRVGIKKLVGWIEAIPKSFFM